MNGEIGVGELNVQIVQKTRERPLRLVLPSSRASERITASEARQCFSMFSF